MLVQVPAPTFIITHVIRAAIRPQRIEPDFPPFFLKVCPVIVIEQVLLVTHPPTLRAQAGHNAYYRRSV